MYYQKGLGLRAEIRPQLRQNYRSEIVDIMRANGFRLEAGGLTFVLAMEFGFCYGVERAVEYAYETVTKFPNRRIFLAGEIIHNPHVNNRLGAMGIQLLSPGPQKYDGVAPEDVVILPAFGIPAAELDLLAKKGCTVVDTTCGSVLNVWKNVERYARAGLTSIIHGKCEHEETQATFSRTTLSPGAHYLIIRDMSEAEVVSAYVRGRGNKEEFIRRFEPAMSRHFDPDRHLERIGLANQTTMLSSESLAIAGILSDAMSARYGDDDMRTRFYSFDTICSATQDRQDAVSKLENANLDLMIVIGGYKSSNTNNLSKIASTFTPTYHIEDATAILSTDEIRHKPAAEQEEVVEKGWLPAGASTIGISAGASTPNNQIGETIERIVNFRGTIVDELPRGALIRGIRCEKSQSDPDHS